MNCLFWNAGEQDVNRFLLNAVLEYDLQLLSLAEYVDNKYDLLNELSRAGYEYYHIPKIGCQRIDLFTIHKPGKIEHMNETSYYTIKRIPHPKLGPLIFVFVHFPSKLHMNEFDFLEESKHFMRDVEVAERNAQSNLTILAGDFNMNPFEEGMMAASAIHSYPTKFEAKKQKRKVKGRTYNMFYNPMWSFFGDNGTPNGTYHYSSSHHLNLYWNMFDQVLVRPPLVDNISPENISIITSIKGEELTDKTGKPKVSDHLPLYFSLN